MHMLGVVVCLLDSMLSLQMVSAPANPSSWSASNAWSPGQTSRPSLGGNLTLWLDANKSSSIGLNYVATGATATAAQGASSITTSVDISATTPTGSLLQIGIDPTSYQVVSVANTVLGVNPNLVQAANVANITIASVANWNDLSGYSFHALQNNAALQPHYSLAQVGGKPAVTFSVQPQYLASSNNGNLQTVFAVRNVMVTDSYDLSWQYLISTPANIDFSVRITNTGRFPTASTGAFPLDYGPGDNNDWAYNTGSLPWVYINGTQTTAVQNANYHIVAAAMISLKANYTYSISNNAYFTNPPQPGGYRGMWGNQGVAELLVLQTTPSNAYRQLIEGYLAWKYNLQNTLPQNHAYRLVPPRK